MGLGGWLWFVWDVLVGEGGGVVHVMACSCAREGDGWGEEGRFGDLETKYRQAVQVDLAWNLSFCFVVKCCDKGWSEC